MAISKQIYTKVFVYKPLSCIIWSHYTVSINCISFFFRNQEHYTIHVPNTWNRYRGNSQLLLWDSFHMLRHCRHCGYSHTRYLSSQWVPNAPPHRRSVASFNSGQALSFGPPICLMDTLQPIWDRKSNRDLIQVLKVNIKRLVPEEAKDTRCPGAGIASGYDLPRWVLGTEHGSSERTVCSEVLCHISRPLICSLLKFCGCLVKSVPSVHV